MRHVRRPPNATALHFFELDVLGEELPEGYDLICSSLFLHHLSEDFAVRLLQAMAAATAASLLVQDLRRTRLGYLFAYAGLLLLTRSDVARSDGLTSVQSAFTLVEAVKLCAEAGLDGARDPTVLAPALRDPLESVMRRTRDDVATTRYWACDTTAPGRAPVVTSWDAIVVGAGPGGAITAQSLARRGASVLLLDRQAFPRWKVCGGCLSAGALGALEAAGLGDPRGEQGAPYRSTASSSSPVHDVRESPSEDPPLCLGPSSIRA